MSVENVKVCYIRPKGYQNLQDWTNDSNNIYIGRKGIVFINTENGKERYPKYSSIWHNPFKIGNGKYTRDESLEKYEIYIKEKIQENPVKYDLNEIKNKNLGCWCKPEKCHGDILLKLLEKI